MSEESNSTNNKNLSKEERDKLAQKKYYLTHKEQRKAKSKEWRINKAEYYSMRRRERSAKEIERGDNKKARLQLIGLLGEKCVECGYNKSVIALQVDHIYGRGKEQFRLFNGTQTMYRYYLNNPWKALRELQVLCANCNAIKRHEMKEDRRKPIYPCMRFVEKLWYRVVTVLS